MRWSWLVLAACGRGAASAPQPAVQIVVEAPGRAIELERTVTIPIERALSGVPIATRMRSATREGHVVITVDVRGDVLAARQEILARLPASSLPAEAYAELGPYTSARGVLLRYALRTQSLSGTALRTWQDWTARPALLRVAGVADVSTCGGAVEQVRIHADPELLAAASLTLDDIDSAVGSSVAKLPPRTAEELRALVVATRNGAPIRVADVAQVEDGSAQPTCFALDDRGPLVVSTVWLRLGGDRDSVGEAVDRALGQLAAQLPPGTTLERVPAEMRGTVQMPHAMTVARQLDAMRSFAKLAPGAVFELGPAVGGFEVGAPDEIRVELRARDDAKRLATGDLSGMRWASDPNGAWIEIFGDDIDQLASALDRTTAGLPVVERIGADKVPALELEPDRTTMARLGVDPGALATALDVMQRPRELGVLREGSRAVEVMLDIPSIESGAIDKLYVRAGDARVPLSQLVRVQRRAEPDTILRDNSRRMVMARVADRDVDALRAKLASVALPPGYELVVEPAQ
jgi:Cu/Ag efflux pump CusA